MSTIRLFLALAAVATGTVLAVLLIWDALDGYTTPSVLINVPLVLTAVEILSFIALGNREHLERHLEHRQAENDLTSLRMRSTR